MLQIVNTINSYLSDYILVFLLVAVGLWYTVKTKCVQRYLWKGLKQLFGGFSLRGGSQGGGMSSFQAVATAIAAQGILWVQPERFLWAGQELFSGCG